MPYVLPVRLWQSRQWQSETLVGSPVHVTRSFRQAQVAVLVAMIITPPVKYCRTEKRTAAYARRRPSAKAADFWSACTEVARHGR